MLDPLPRWEAPWRCRARATPARKTSDQTPPGSSEKRVRMQDWLREGNLAVRTAHGDGLGLLTAVSFLLILGFLLSECGHHPRS